MRITTHMLNESTRKAGLPLTRHSLLDYVNGNGNGSVLNALQAKSKTGVTTLNKSKYEKQEKAADDVTVQAWKFLIEGADSIFEKAKETGNTEEICKETEVLAEKYNEMLSSMEKGTGAQDKLYYQSLKDLAGENKEQLEKVGILISKDGSLKVDKEKLEAASLEDLKKVLGREGSFMTDLFIFSVRAADNAQANLESMSGSYLSNGNMINQYSGKYDFRG